MKRFSSLSASYLSNYDPYAPRQMAATPPDCVRALSLAAWNFARANHTRERFATAHKTFAESVVRH